MMAHVMCVVLGLLCAGTENNGPGIQDTTSLRDSSQIVDRTSQEIGKPMTIQTASAESPYSTVSLTFPDGSVEEISSGMLMSFVRKNPLSRPVILCELLVPSTRSPARHGSYTGLSRLLPSRARQLTPFEQMAMRIQRYQEYPTNPALPKPGGQINLLPALKWLISQLW